MKIIVAGLNHKSAPIDIREKLAFDAVDTIKALTRLTNKFPEAEFVLLSTCNRVELYSVIPSSVDVACVNAETKADLPTFGAPTIATLPAPSLSICQADSCLPFFFMDSEASLSLDKRRRKSARR